MNIWDSVQRGLEKASQEAARIAKQQRLRASIDQLSRQLNTQHNAIVGRAVDLFNSNQLTQSELIPMCQELMNLHNQLMQAQNELKLIQSTPPPAPQQQGALPPAPGQTPIPPASSPTPPGMYPSAHDTPTIYAPPPPDYQFYADPTLAAPTAPPPPGMEPPTISSADTLAMEDVPAPAGPQYCFLCHTAILPGHAFCNNCGTPVGDLSSSYLPTSRASSTDEQQGTVRASMYGMGVPATPPPPPGGEYGTIPASDLENPAPVAPPPPTDDETVRAPNPNPASQPPNGGQ